MDIELIMEFINENIVWVSIGAVVLIMALIGFIAEKTDFGRKPKVEKAPRKPKHVKEEDAMFEELDDEPHDQPVAEQPVESIEEVQMVEETPVVEEINEEVFEPATLEAESTVDLEQPIEEITELSPVDLEQVVVEEPASLEVVEETIDGPVPEVLETSVAPTVETISEENSLNAPLPELDNIANEEENADEANDWKF